MKIKKLASIDVGSNGVRMLINSVYDDGEKVTFNKTSLVRVPIRLGKDSFLQGKISPENTGRLIKAMQAYKLLMEVNQVEDYLAYATSALREVSNGIDIVSKIEKEAGINLQIIDGEREAKVIFATELSNFVEDDNSYLYIDVGGGSTELTVLTKGKVLTSKSFPVGTVRWLNGKVSEDFLKNDVKLWVKENCRGLGNLHCIGSGGNINYIFKQSDMRSGRPLMYAYLNKERKTISKLSYEERLQEYNMKPDRADVIVPALEIYTQIMKYARSKKIYVPKIGLADGMIQYLYQNKYMNS